MPLGARIHSGFIVLEASGNPMPESPCLPVRTHPPLPHSHFRLGAGVTHVLGALLGGGHGCDICLHTVLLGLYGCMLMHVHAL